MAKFRDLTGQKFGRWTVLSLASRCCINENGKKDGVRWRCQCDCGTISDSQLGSHIVYGKSVSCGCLRNEILSERRKTHGMSETTEYYVWLSMKDRCKNPSNKRYYSHGARGVTVCDAWDDFQNFYNDVGPRPSDKHSIERVDNDGNYCPENCKWETDAAQANNKRNNVRLTYNGETKSLMQWCRHLNLSYSVVLARVSDRGWDTVRALETPCKPFVERVKPPGLPPILITCAD